MKKALIIAISLKLLTGLILISALQWTNKKNLSSNFSLQTPVYKQITKESESAKAESLNRRPEILSGGIFSAGNYVATR